MTEKLSVAEKNRLKTTEKVTKALETLKKGKKMFTIEDVAEKAQISRRTLYNREDLMELVRESRSLMEDKLNPKKKVEETKGDTQSVQETRLYKLREQNKSLKEDKRKLLEQNLILTQKLTDLERKYASLEERLFQSSNLKVVEFGKGKQGENS